MPFMYILECADGSYYTGSTWDLERRLWEHQNGLGAHHTAKRLPVKLVYYEESDRIDDAFYREKQVQGWCHKKKEALIAGDTNLIHILAECRNESHCRRFRSLSVVEDGEAERSLRLVPERSRREVEGSGRVEDAGFDFAQPPGDFAQPEKGTNCSLSEVEGSNVDASNKELRGIIE